MVALNYVLGVISLIFFILVIVKMFQAGANGIAIVCLVLLLCGGIGSLIAFIAGWVKQKEWGIPPGIMIGWTVVIILGIVVYIIAPPPLPFTDA